MYGAGPTVMPSGAALLRNARLGTPFPRRRSLSDSAGVVLGLGLAVIGVRRHGGRLVVSMEWLAFMSRKRPTIRCRHDGPDGPRPELKR